LFVIPCAYTLLAQRRTGLADAEEAAAARPLPAPGE
jgi:hypothetical protein